MNLLEFLRNRVDVIIQRNKLKPLEALDFLIGSSKEREDLLDKGPYMGVEIDDQKLDEAFRLYRNELLRVKNISTGDFYEEDNATGEPVFPDENTCWGNYYRRLTGKVSEEDLARILKECNVVNIQFLPQLAQIPDRRGLVIGQVQSGKTTIFNGIISRAADIGFNVILILSGTIESLRKQTQNRIANDVTIPWAQKKDSPFSFTWISNFTGSGLKVAGNASIVLQDLNSQSRRQIAIGVFLKNSTVLANLIEFLKTINPADAVHLRVLIIDDEADQATPNAGVNKETITKINGAIKNLVNRENGVTCPTQTRSCYLGFTATPFANLLNEAGFHTLYPKDFIYFLRSSERYFGPWQLFGNPDEVEGAETIIPIDVVRMLDSDDINGTVPLPKKKYDPIITQGLRKAILWFVMASAAKRMKDSEVWSTMLIHTSSKTSDHQELYTKIKKYLNLLDEDWKDKKTDWQNLWTDEIARVTMESFSQAFPKYGEPAPSDYPSWNDIAKEIPDVIKDVKIRMDNSLALAAGFCRLDYSENTPKSERLQIAIGGNTLSRGLTLEGLVSSYFARRFTKQSAYDTLLQMGRWFGFRQGYELLPRLWTTPSLRDSFRELVIMEHDLRKMMDIYLLGTSPAQHAPVIRRMPGMAITRKSVMGRAVTVEADFSGTAPQTILFKNDLLWLNQNITATINLMHNLTDKIEPDCNTHNRLIYRDVMIDDIMIFLQNYNIRENTNTFNKSHILKFIESNKALFTYWSVVVLGGSSQKEFIIKNYSVQMNNRSRIREIAEYEPILINLKSLRSTQELLCDEPELYASRKPSKETEYWDIRREEDLNPVLIIYPIDQDSTYTPRPTLDHRAPLKDYALADVIGISLIMCPPGNRQGAVGVQLDLGDVYLNDNEADNNPDEPIVA